MATLYRYLRDYWKLVAAALVLAAINQVFSLLDPLIFRHIIDSYATRFHEYTSAQFIRGVSAPARRRRRRGIRLPRRQEFSGLLRQRDHPTSGRAHLCRRHPALARTAVYAQFEDQRSGETLGKLQKVRTDVEKLITMLRQPALHHAHRRDLRHVLRVRRCTGPSARPIC